MKNKYLFLFIIMLLTACASTDQSQPSNLTVGTVKTTIVEGKTSQADLLENFGSPNLISRNADGEEVWAYNRMSYQSKKESSGFSLILVGSSKALSSQASRSFDLILTFDKNEIVKSYKVIYAAY